MILLFHCFYLLCMIVLCCLSGVINNKNYCNRQYLSKLLVIISAVGFSHSAQTYSHYKLVLSHTCSFCSNHLMKKHEKQKNRKTGIKCVNIPCLKKQAEIFVTTTPINVDQSPSKLTDTSSSTQVNESDSQRSTTPNYF